MIGLPPVNAFVLHRTPYRESSSLVRLFVPGQGQLVATWRGTAALHLYQPYHIDWQASGDWVTIRSVDLAGKVLRLKGQALYLALYLNELLGVLLPRWVPAEALFGTYYATLRRLESGESAEPLLRFFERRLLEQLGFGIDFERDRAGELLQPERHYRFDDQNAFLQDPSSIVVDGFHGQDLIHIAHNDYGSPSTRRAAKQLFRRALALQLGERELLSRRFLQPLVSPSHSSGTPNT
ncbi:DNA repair protein RecO [Salinispirillum sp. LH 10-3-1]|uniref:DNA repair protein RecO n=1 Tax=Salinispirillum sp. LH 10-3-1 TaxID=2952525 RepID=A0AB38YDV5_9GAMM